MKLPVEFRPDWGQLTLGSRLWATGSVDFHDQLLLYLPMKTDHLSLITRMKCRLHVLLFFIVTFLHHFNAKY